MSYVDYNKLFVASALFFGLSQGLLYPRETSTREVRRLDGIWKFKLAPMNEPYKGFNERWFEDDWDKRNIHYEPTAVPASYNDLSQDAAVRDHVGYAWYQRNFIVPSGWKRRRIVLNFGSVHYNAAVFVNGKKAMEHTIGHLPFEAEVGDLLNEAEQNVLTVAVNNTLTLHTLPQGSLTLKINNTNYPPFFYKNKGNFDFFNYAGIHRGVFLYGTEKTFVSDVVVRTVTANTTESRIFFNVTLSGVAKSNAKCQISIRNKQNSELLSTRACSMTVSMKNVNLWWPYTHTKDTPGYQYTLIVRLLVANKTVDEYPVKFGIRTIDVRGEKVLLNGSPFYFTGFGKHEDAAVRGKGLDLPLIVKDINLMKWLGANSFRTSHYPYSEELMDLCDEMGIVVIDECPAVGLGNFNDVVFSLHKKSLTELISRDKNRPSVFMWSIANEPNSKLNQSESYFSKIAGFVKSLDKSRPITAALNVNPLQDFAAQFLDVIMFNKYASWYSDTGSLEVIERQVVNAAKGWIEKHGKPVLISEYGADAVSGLHSSPASAFSEDYQSELLVKHHYAFDTLRSQGGFVGEHIWNFADFLTAQGITRVIGNRKGILTRDREPKASARIIRCRYHRVGKLTIDDDAYYCLPPKAAPRNEHFEL